MKIYLLFLIGTLVFLSSCFKEDDRVPAHNPGNVKTDTIAMTQYYKNQVYFDLGTGQAVGTHLKSDCDLGFECSPDGWRVILNTATFMMAADAGIRPFGQAVDTTGLKFWYDKSDGNMDSLAIGKWFSVQGNDTVSNQHLYILNRGMDEGGFELGFRQLSIDSLKNGTYYFRLSNLNGTNQQAYAVKKDPAYNFMYFTFKFGGVVKEIEPPKNSYDLVFTQYTTLLFTDAGEPYPYLVTGVLINRNAVEVAVDSVSAFESITIDKLNGYTYSRRLDYIGYEWKHYSFDLGSYTVDSKLTYIIRDTEGIYYKMRFISFYNALGQKGYPVIEFQAL